MMASRSLRISSMVASPRIDHRAAPGLQRLTRAKRRRSRPPVGKSGPGTISSRASVLISGSSIQSQTGVDHLAQIVRRDLGGHADRDAVGAIDQQIGNARRQDDRLALRAVVVILEIDRVLVEIGQNRHGRLWSGGTPV